MQAFDRPLLWQPAFSFSAPTGRLDSWMKVSRDHTHKLLNVHLFWKVHTTHMLLDTRHKLVYFLVIALVERVWSAFKISHFLLLLLLFFQPSKQFRANSQNVSYVVSVQKLQNEKGKRCTTMGNYCTFQVSRGAKKVYLSAANAVGRSNPTEVRIYLPKGKADTLKSA